MGLIFAFAGGFLYLKKPLLTDVHTFITEVSKSVIAIAIAERDEMLFGLLSRPEQTSVSGFFLFREADLCCVLVSFDAGLLWRGCPEVQASCEFRESKEAWDATDVRCFCCLFLCLLDIRYFFQTISSIRPS